MQLIVLSFPHVGRCVPLAVSRVKISLATEDEAIFRPEDGKKIVVVLQEKVLLGKRALTLTRSTLVVILVLTCALVKDACA